MEIGDRIAAKRKELGWTQQELADKLGFKSKSTINKVELGINQLTPKKVVAYAKALNCSPYYLMGWEPDSSDNQINAAPENRYDMLQIFAEEKEKPTVAGELESMSDKELDALFMQLIRNRDKDFLLRLASQILELASKKES